MFITCQQCSTIFRLDESLLKPTGSKVRCSQCRNVFVEYPPAPATEASGSEGATAVQAVTEAPSEAAIDQELEGIDLDELDSILEQSDFSDPSADEDIAALAAEPEADVVAELNDDDLDMDFNLDIDPESAAEPKPVQEVAAEVTEGSEDALDPLDLDMDFNIVADETPISSEAKVADAVEPVSEELDMELEGLDDLDFTLETGDSGEITEVDEAPTVESEEDSGPIDFELDLEEAEDAAEPAEPDLALDTEDQEPDLRLDEDDDALHEVAAEDEKTEGDADEFDLTELDAMLGSEDVEGRVSSGLSRDAVDESAELSLADGPGEPAKDTTEAETDMESPDEPEGLDLSDLDAMLDEVDGQPDPVAEQASDASADDDLGLEDLEFELDAEFEDKPIAPKDDAEAEQLPEAEDAAEDEEIDLSDIEQMLEGDDEALDTQQLEADFLGLDDDEKGEKWKDDSPELDLDDTDEINLGEIEAAIDMADSDSDGETDLLDGLEDEELSLDDTVAIEEEQGADLDLADDIVLELESDESAEDSLEAELEADLEEDELDLSDLDLGEDQESSDEPEVIDTGDIELEFQVEEEGDGIEAQAGQSAGKDIPTDNETFSIEDTIPAHAAASTNAESTMKPVKAKKSTSKGLVFLFIIILLGGLGYVYYAVTYQGMNIPYVSDILKPKAKDPAGIQKLTTSNINSKFVDTDNNGRLFVIEGKVRNGYSEARKMIRLQGKLFTKGKVLAKSEFAYAGVLIDDQEMTTLSVADLKKRLNSGIAQGGTTDVAPGRTVEFMVVFSELPEDLDEFAIEVISSMPAK